MILVRVIKRQMHGFCLEQKYLPTMGTPSRVLKEYVKYSCSHTSLRCLLYRRDIRL
jgi:hypothetical protein